MDNSRSSDETKIKWLQRREKEILTKCKRIPLNLDKLMFEEFQKYTRNVYADTLIDADHVIAKLASHNNSYMIFSSDRDMFRYNIPSVHLNVFASATMSNDHDLRFWRGVNLRMKYDMTKIDVHQIPSVYPSGIDTQCSLKNGYFRGVSDSHSDHGNLHHLARPIRLQLYKHLKIRSIREVYPILNTNANTVLWIDETLSVPDDLHCTDIHEWYDQIAMIDPMPNPTEERIFAQKSLISEYVSILKNCSYSDVLYDMVQLESHQHKPWSNNGTFRFCHYCQQKIHISSDFLNSVHVHGFTFPTTCGICKFKNHRKAKRLS